MKEIQEQRAIVQETMNFLGALACGIEESIGRSANSMAYVAGKKLGKQFAAKSATTNDISAALDEVRKVLQDNNCLWNFEPFQKKNQPKMVEQIGGNDEIMLVFRDCMIRESLFRYGHPQKGSLCNMMYGFFAGALELIMGRKSKLEIVHAGENACYKRLIIHS